MHDVFSRKIDKTKSATLIDTSDKKQEESVKILSNEFNAISVRNKKRNRYLQKKSLKGMSSYKQTGMDLSPKSQVDMYSHPIAQKREPNSLPVGAKFTASM